MITGSISRLSLANHSDSGVLPGGAFIAQPRWMPAKRILGGGRTHGVSFWPYLNFSSWWWLVSSVFLTRTSCSKIIDTNGYYGAYPGGVVSVSVLLLTQPLHSDKWPLFQLASHSCAWHTSWKNMNLDGARPMFNPGTAITSWWSWTNELCEFVASFIIGILLYWHHRNSRIIWVDIGEVSSVVTRTWLIVYKFSSLFSTLWLPAHFPILSNKVPLLPFEIRRKLNCISSCYPSPSLLCSPLNRSINPRDELLRQVVRL